MAAVRTRTTPIKAAQLSRGEAFKQATVDANEMTLSELELLGEVAALLDEIDALAVAIGRDGVTVEGSQGQTRVHPALGEVRQHRLALGRLLAQLAVPDIEGESLSSSVSARARTAAQKRWAAGS